MPTKKRRYTITGDESQADADYEQRGHLAAERLADRFRRPGGLDYLALGEASAVWLGE